MLLAYVNNMSVC